MDGSIVNATVSQYADLFTALKGGMSNFGICPLKMNLFRGADG